MNWGTSWPFSLFISYIMKGIGGLKKKETKHKKRILLFNKAIAVDSDFLFFILFCFVSTRVSCRNGRMVRVGYILLPPKYNSQNTRVKTRERYQPHGASSLT